MREMGNSEEDYVEKRRARCNTARKDVKSWGKERRNTCYAVENFQRSHDVTKRLCQLKRIIRTFEKLSATHRLSGGRGEFPLDLENYGICTPEEQKKNFYSHVPSPLSKSWLRRCAPPFY